MTPSADLAGHSAVVTGANSGVGRSAAELLLAAGAAVTLVCRDRGRGERALAEFSRAFPAAAVSLELADMAAPNAVRELAGRLLERLDRIDILINNAGVWRNRLETTADGFELTFATNHLGHFLLTHLLLERLRGGAQIVNVSSEAHRYGDLRRAPLEEIARGRAWRGGIQAYSDSKLANALFTVESVRRWGAYGLTANALNPGVLATRIWNQNRGPLARSLQAAKVFLRRPEVGGAAVLGLVQRPPQERVTGRYFQVGAEATPQPQVTDRELARSLWERSAEWTGLP